MEKNPGPYEKIILVCTNHRDPGERVCCGSAGAAVIRDGLKGMVKDRLLVTKIRVCKSSCLNFCEDGPNVLILPDNIWFSKVTEADLDDIFRAAWPDGE